MGRFYLNTTRHLSTPASDAVVEKLKAELELRILPSLEDAPNLRTIRWLISKDRSLLQSFSELDSWDAVQAGEDGSIHQRNSRTINELVGGLSRPQLHTHYEFVAGRSFAGGE